MSKRPYVTVSFAQSLDGRIATAVGDSQWIGGPESLRLAHELRNENDAVLVGIGTVLKDNPLLTARISGGRHPVRVVLDGHLRIPLDSRLVLSQKDSPVWVFHSSAASAERKSELASKGVRLTEVPETEQGLELSAILDVLASGGIESLFVEGGSQIITSFLKNGLVDRYLAVTAPLLLGKGTEAVGDLGILHLQQALRPLRSCYQVLGQDLGVDLIFREPDIKGR